MPQTTNLKVKRDLELSPVGPGTVFNQMVAVGVASRARAQLANKTEALRLEKIRKMIEREHHHAECQQNRVIARTRRTLREKEALLNLFIHDYRVDTFITMKPGFNSSNIETKHEARRYVMESRVFNSGFTMKALKPEVHRRLRKLDPDRKYKVFKQKLLDQNREKNVEINRGISNSAFRRMLHDKANWRKYNFPSGPAFPPEVVCDIAQTTYNTTERNKNDPDNKIQEVDSGVIQGESVKEQTRPDEVERRPFRRNVNAGAFGMTMRTLGPVYFQAPAHSSSNTELRDR